jgi:DNA-binding NtrC family response regulator
MKREILPMPAVLVVDDESLIRWSLAEGLADAGHEVRQASTAAQALAAIEIAGHAPLVILLDVRLPDVSDLSLIRQVRVRWPDLPVIVMTAHGTDAEVDDMLDVGVCAVVGKPFDVSAVVALVGDTWNSTQVTNV